MLLMLLQGLTPRLNRGQIGTVATRVPVTEAAGFSLAADLTAACLAEDLPLLEP